ncbi:hypothetical protein [Streptomyces sp. NPDC005322]|uniref:hypothetical protein n=1 Tax=Streptomyces sp. NPDC005322 TaxID=3157032 RepID=UPI0033B08CFB
MSDPMEARTAGRVRHFADDGHPGAEPLEAVVEGTRFADEFGYDIDDLLLYRAACAMATSDAFTPGGGDEHFAWCASVLNDSAVADALER